VIQLGLPNLEGWILAFGGGTVATASTEEYLEAIYKMEDEGALPISARLAERLHVSAPSVAEMIKKLARTEYVTIGPGKEISLTKKGRFIAEALVRRHRLSERLLTDVLGLQWDVVHDQACLLEHTISPEMEEGMIRALGNPATCPHGFPIPGVAPGSKTGISGVTRLSQATEGTDYRVERVAEEDASFLQYVGQLGLVLGAELFFLERAPFDGPLTLSVNGKTVAVGLEAASRIWVSAA